MPMRHWIAYVIAAVFFVGGYTISSIDWSATPGPPIPCGGGKTVWHENVPDQTKRTPTPLIMLPRPATDRTEGSQLEPAAGAPAAAAPAVAEPQRHFC
jgi:hypothetical protein